MSPAVIEPVLTAVARRTGVPVRGISSAPSTLRIEPHGVARTRAFAIELQTGWRHVSAAFIPGRFARTFIRNLGNGAPENRIAFSALARTPRNHRLTVAVNGHRLDLSSESRWPSEWKDFALTLRRGRVVPEELSPRELAGIFTELAVPAFAMVVALAGVEGVEADESALEGDAVERQSRRYERKPINREICLSLKGHRCWCCDLDFGERYGAGSDGMIEVHHRVPVAGMGPGYRVHPVRDLFPVCANCHAVIHHRSPAEDPEALRLRLRPRT